jgi:hypothetical protein
VDNLLRYHVAARVSMIPGFSALDIVSRHLKPVSQIDSVSERAGRGARRFRFAPESDGQPSRCDSVVECQEWTHALQQTASLFNQFVGAGVALLGRLALTVAQNLGIAAERIHDCGRDKFDTR